MALTKNEYPDAGQLLAVPIGDDLLLPGGCKHCATYKG